MQANFSPLYSIAAGVTLHGGPRASSLFNISAVNSFHREYSSKACTIEIVDNVEGAIEHIHKFGRYY